MMSAVGRIDGPTNRKCKTLAIGVTVFRPDMSLLAPLLAVAQASAEAVYLFIDGPVGFAIDASTLEQLKRYTGLSILHGQDNRGVATGLNRLASAAVEDNFHHMVFFDQDSTLTPSLIEKLCDDFSELKGKGESVAAVGPLPSSAIGSDTKPPRYGRHSACRYGEMRTVTFLINSGMLIDLGAYRRIGPFYEPYGMDSVDLEWCFRAWSTGYSIWVDENLDLPHRIGSGVVGFGPFSFPRQSEMRMKSYMRNQAHLLTQPHTPWRWKLRTALYAPMQAIAFVLVSESRKQTALGILRAARDGLRGNFTNSLGSRPLPRQS